MFRKILRLTNRRARLLVGLFLAGLFCVQCMPTDANSDSTVKQVIDGKVIGGANDKAAIEKMAKTDHVALLEYCLKHYNATYKDYTCTLIKQERIRGTLGAEQWVQVKFLEKPFSVSMCWTKNAPIGDRVVYVEGKYNNQMLVRPRGLVAKIVGTVLRDPDGAEAMKNTLRPVNMFGFHRGIQSLIDVYQEARKAGDSKETFGDYVQVNGRKTIVLVRQLPPKGDYPANVTKTYIDLEYLVPIMIEGTDWDNDLLCRYRYQDVKFNVGLNSDAFLPENNDMQPPK